MVAPRRACHRTCEEAGLTPLSFCIAACSSEKLVFFQNKIKQQEVSRLISLYTTALVKRERVAAFLLALELTWRGIAPAFRKPEASAVEERALDIDQEYDQVVHDIVWLRAQYQTHRQLLSPPITTEPESWKWLFSFTDRLFYLGNRPLWFIVKKLKLSDKQQWECRVLQSLPVKRKARGLDRSAQSIYAKLVEKLPSIMRTMVKADDYEERAHEILRKRKRLWMCAEMCDWSPTETARLYKCMTGETLTKSHIANQLDAIREHKRKPQPRRARFVDEK